MILQISRPNFSPAFDALREFSKRRESGTESIHLEILGEIRRRLQRLEHQSQELVALNNKLWAKKELSVTVESESNTIIVRVGDDEQRFKLNRADTQTPLSLIGSTAIAVYDAGKADPIDDEEAVLQLELEEKLESYYQSAHRILKLFGRIPALRSIRCAPISRVRNELIEHPPDGALYSFGVGSAGPQVKPISRGTPSFHDEGLLPNSEALIQSIVSACASPHPNSTL